MKLICFIGYLFPILMMDVVSRKVHNIGSYPIHFNYKFGDLLTIEIALKNIPKGVGYYFIYNADFTKIREGPIVLKYSGDYKIDVSYLLKSLKQIIYIELYKYDVLCTDKRIWSGNATQVISGMCTSGRERCTIEVNLKNKCEGENHEIICYMTASEYICESSPLVSTPTNTIHYWYQTSTANNDNIGLIPTTTASRTKLIIKLEHFDMYTYINSVIEFQGEKLHSKNKFISYIWNSIQEDNFTILKYSDSEDYEFTCKEYLDRTSAATPHSSYNSILFIAAVIGTVFIILITIIIILIRKLYSNTSEPEETLELETFAPQNNTATYANMDYHCGGNQPRNYPDESNYATIVGVLKQSTGQGKKKSIK